MAEGRHVARSLANDPAGLGLTVLDEITRQRRSERLSAASAVAAGAIFLEDRSSGAWRSSMTAAQAKTGEEHENENCLR